MEPETLPPGPPPAVPLGYESSLAAAGRRRQRWADEQDLLIYLFRRLAFAVGAGLLTSGLVGALARQLSDATETRAGWGAFLVALVVPFPGLWRHWPDQRAMPDARAGAAERQ